jgi:hypothetical protein
MTAVWPWECSGVCADVRELRVVSCSALTPRWAAKPHVAAKSTQAAPGYDAAPTLRVAVRELRFRFAFSQITSRCEFALFVEGVV